MSARTGCGRLRGNAAHRHGAAGRCHAFAAGELGALRGRGRTPGAARRGAAPDFDEVLAELREGCWVDLYSKRRWRRAQLVWASSKGTLFMFVSHGSRPHSMTQRICRRLVEERLLRQVPTEEVVAKALRSLEREAGQAAVHEAARPAAGPVRVATHSRPAALAG